LAAAARGENMSITKENHMDIDTHDELETGLETKAGIPSDAVVTHAELMRAFEEFKEANEQKLAEKRSIDVVLEEKIARIDNTITTQTTPSGVRKREGPHRRPIELMRAWPRDEFPNCKVPAYGPGHSQGIQYRRVARTEIFVVMERANINRIRSENGCHTCGDNESGTSNWTTLSLSISHHGLVSVGVQRCIRNVFSCSSMARKFG
jgi:hypothetical protein